MKYILNIYQLNMFMKVKVDHHLSWNANTDKICKKVTSGIEAIRRLRDFFDKDTLLTVYFALVQPHLDCCCVV